VEPHLEVFMADRLLLGPAVLFLTSTVYATAVSASEPDLPGEPFGIRIPGQVRTHLALGLGSAIAAPWPLPALAMWAAVRGSPSSTWAARATTIIGVGTISGILSEPATWGRRPTPLNARGNVALGLAVGAAMASVGIHRLRQQSASDSA
jgi:hypothetical protein